MRPLTHAARAVLAFLLCVVLGAAARAQTFAPTGNMATARREHTATLLPNGKVLVAGGIGTGTTILASAELYDPASSTFAATGALNAARYAATATLLGNGKILIAGGAGRASAELYDPASGTFTPTGNMGTGRYQHTATLLNNGQVLITGGLSSSGAPLASAELYNPALGTFTSTGNLNAARYLHTATLLNNGQLLVTGGSGASGYLTSAELYDPATGTFAVTQRLTAPRGDHTATLLSSGKVLVVGGYNGSNYLASAELYDPTTSTFSSGGSLHTARDLDTATLLQNGQILFASGRGTGANGGDIYLTSAELYDPTTSTFSATGSLGTARTQHTATLLGNGQVLVSGGYDSSGFLASAELYIPAPATTGALISQFRLSGPNGSADEFIELANTTGAALNVSGWNLVAGSVSVPITGTIPAFGHLLLANSGGYSLGAIAVPDVTYSGDIPASTNRPGDIPTGTALSLNNAAGTVVDSVGAYLPAYGAPASLADQYAYVRRLESGSPSNIRDNAADFNLVDTAATSSTTDRTGVGAMGGAARLGSPNPHNAASTIQRNGSTRNAPYTPPGLSAYARYGSRGSSVDSKGRLTIRRTITNNSGANVSKLRFRIVAITAGMSTTSGVADLRAISSGGVRYFDGNGQLQRGAYGMTLDAPTMPTEAPLTAASTGNGGGLNAGWTAPLPGGTLAAGASVNVEFLFGIQAEGQFRIVVDAEVLP